jgi:YHS domain-containing protein
MVRFLLFLLLLYFVLRAVSRLVRGLREGLHGPADTQPPAVPLVRDPVCGTYVVPSRALTAGEGAETRFFCSEKCRRAYRVKPVR